MDSQYLAIIVAATLMVLLQFLIFEKTLLGKKLQATSQDKEMASLLGIPVATMILITFGYSAALGGLAGVLVAPVLFVSVGMGALISLKAFAANIIGGFGNIPGAILGGLALGIVETFGAAYISVPYKDAIAFALLLLFLLIRPQGLFGEKIAEEGMTAPLAVPQARVWRGLPALLVAIVVMLIAATLVPRSGYILNIVMQAATYAIGVAGPGRRAGLLRPDLAGPGRVLRPRRLWRRPRHHRFRPALLRRPRWPGSCLPPRSAPSSASPACASAATTSPWSPSASSRS